MTLSLSRVGLAVLALFAAFSIGLTLVLLPRLGGPGVSLSDGFKVTASFPDAQQLETKAVVLVRGVEVGTVEEIDVRGDRSVVSLEIEPKYAPVYRDATARIGQRTAIGDAYVDMRLGSPRSGALAEGDAIRRVGPTVEFDEAFSTFDEDSRADAVATLKTFGRGARSPETAARWGATVDRLSATVHEVGGLANALRDQEQDIAQLVSGSRVVLRELGSRQSAISSLVSDGRRTLDVFGDRPARFAAGLRELPPLLNSARAALAKAEPLLSEARPLVADLSAAAPDLRATFHESRPVAGDLEAAVARLPAFNRAALPFFRQALPVVDVARPFAKRMLPALQNLVPMMRYLSPRAPELAAWFSNTGAMSMNRFTDTKGRWIRFLIFTEPMSAYGRSDGPITRNAYKDPLDAKNPQPGKPGSFPRLLPFMP